MPKPKNDKKEVVFNFENQTVVNQYNSAGEMTIHVNQNSSNIIYPLEMLQLELLQMLKDNHIQDENAQSAKAEIGQAIETAKSNPQNTGKILGHLDTLKEIVGGISILAGLIAGINQVIDVIKNLK